MSASHFGPRPRERLTALAAVVAVQALLAIALLFGLRVSISRDLPEVQRLIRVALPEPAAVKVPKVVLAEKPVVQGQSASAAAAPRSGGASGAQVVPIQAIVAANAGEVIAPVIGSANGPGTGENVGAGGGTGAGGQGTGTGSGGGTDLEHIAGEIRASDYPPHLRRRGQGGRVGILFVVSTSGRVSRCTVTASSGVPELDLLTCRLIQDRFVYRPSTDASGRPIADEVEGEHEWIARGR